MSLVETTFVRPTKVQILVQNAWIEENSLDTQIRTFLPELMQVFKQNAHKRCCVFAKERYCTMKQRETTSKF